MSYTETTLIFDGTDLRDLPMIVQDWAGLYAPMIRRGSHDTIPGAAGQLGAELPLDAYTFAVPIVVLGDDHEEANANLATICSALLGSSGLGAMTRRLARTASPFYDAYTADGQFASFNAFSLYNPKTAQTELTFVNLSGAWRKSADNSFPHM
jgi:hypothetical protein